MVNQGLIVLNLDLINAPSLPLPNGTMKVVMKGVEDGITDSYQALYYNTQGSITVMRYKPQ
jgi:hypothetical protein